MPILLELFLTFAKIGAFTFGGGYAMLALLDLTCVEKKKWLTADEFSDLTVIAESTPGPIAINCSTYAGYKKAKLPGAIAATFGMVMPSFIILLLISLFFENILAYPIIAKAFGDGYFDFVLGGTPEIRHKPDAHGINYIRKMLGFKPEDTYMIGDLPADTAAAVSANVGFIGALWGYSNREKLAEKGAYVFAEKPTEILDIIQKGTKN